MRKIYLRITITFISILFVLSVYDFINIYTNSSNIYIALAFWGIWGYLLCLLIFICISLSISFLRSSLLVKIFFSCLLSYFLILSFFNITNLAGEVSLKSPITISFIKEQIKAGNYKKNDGVPNIKNIKNLCLLPSSLLQGYRYVYIWQNQDNIEELGTLEFVDQSEIKIHVSQLQYIDPNDPKINHHIEILEINKDCKKIQK